jgi:hypothetical protein
MIKEMLDQEVRSTVMRSKIIGFVTIVVLLSIIGFVLA